MARYIAVLPLVSCRTESGGYVSALAGDLLPADTLQEDIDRFLSYGDDWITEAPFEVDPDEPGAVAGPGDLPSSVKDIKAAVGTDAELAQQYLTAEGTAAEPRTTLITHLEKVIAASSS